MRKWLVELAKTATREMGEELRQRGIHGSHEAAALLFNQNAFVMYPRAGHDDPQMGKATPDVQSQGLHAQKDQPQIEREM